MKLYSSLDHILFLLAVVASVIIIKCPTTNYDCWWGTNIAVICNVGLIHFVLWVLDTCGSVHSDHRVDVGLGISGLKIKTCVLKFILKSVKSGSVKKSGKYRIVGSVLNTSS